MTGCPVEGCPHDVWSKGLCLYHYKRRRAGKPLVDPRPRQGTPSGFGRYGVVDRDEHSVLCHECGQRFTSVAGHIYAAHGLRASDYKTRHGIPSGEALVCESLRRTQREKSQGRVGTEQWKRLEDARDPDAAQRARTPESHQRRDREKAAQTARVNGRARTARVYSCLQCGAQMSGRRVTCSPECEAAHRLSALAAYRAERRVELTPAERAELAGAADPGALVRHHQARGVTSTDLAHALGRSVSWLSARYPRSVTIEGKQQ